MCALAAGDRLGRYELVDRLGAGSMGEVWTANDPELGRKVAIKVLRDELAVESERLRAEARAMAQLGHPGVVAVHDVGEASGRVFVAMELVDGTSMRAWLATPRPWREVVATFVAAGRGLAAAHDAGLVHRDVKPDNILIARSGRVAVGDFGISRLAADGDDAAEHAGTPPYMAPEVHQGKPATAASDQFAFCVSLWEGVYGRRPFRAEKDDELGTAASVGLAIVGGRMTPPPDGVRIPGWLRRALARGLATDPAGRFPSMDALVATLEGGLARRRRVILAGVASGALAATGVAAVMLFGGGDSGPRCRLAAEQVETAWNPSVRARLATAFGADTRPHVAAMLERVVDELDRRARTLGGARIAACEATHVRGEQSEAALDRHMACLDHQIDELAAVVSLLGAKPDAEVIDGARDIVSSLDPPSDCAAEARTEQPVPPSAVADRVSATRRALADVRALFSAGRFAAARTAIEPFAATARDIGYAPLSAEVLFLRGKIIAELGEAKAGEEALQEAAVAAAAADDDVRAADALLTQLELLTDQGGKPIGAEERLGPAEVAVTRADRPAVREQFLVARSGVRYLLGKYDEARVDLEAALASRGARLGELSAETANIRMRLADTLGKAGKTPEAIALLRTALAQYEESLGREHPKVGRVLDSLAIRVWSAGDYDEARRLGERALSISERALGAEHPQVANALNTLGSIAQDQGRTDDQAALHERALAIREKALGAEHPSVANSLSNLAIARRRQGRVDEALALQTRAQAIREKTLGSEHPSIASMLLTRATILNEMKRFDEALAAATRALAIRQKTLGPDHAQTGWAHGTVGGVLEGLGRKREACAEYAKTVDILERASGRDHPDLAAWLGFHVKCLLASRRTRDALDAAERAVAIGEKSGRDPMQLAEVRFLLGQALWASGGDRARAVAQVKLAHDVYAAGSAYAQEQAKPLAAWLASHRAP